MIRNFVLIIFLFTGAAQGAGEEEKYDEFKGVRFYSQGPAVDFIRDGNEFSHCRGIREVLDRLGAPQKTREAFESQGRKSTVLYYEGLSLEFLEDTADSALCWLRAVVIQSPRWKVARDLGVGAAQDKVSNALGTPSETRDDADYYWSDNEAGEYVLLSYAEGKVNKIEWRCYGD
jgi:hypothetical protein